MHVSRRALLGGAAVAVAGLAVTESAVAAPRDRSLIALRRDLNRHPEVAGKEERTAAVVAKRLRAAGLDVTTGVGGYGVVGVLAGARRGRTVAYRADMDAVPAEDQFPPGTGPAHVCGHDIHTTVGVGVAEALACQRDRLAGTVVFVFQPAEETLEGAAAMLAGGVFAEVQPTEIHAMHCSWFPVGQFAVTSGFGLPGLDQGAVTVTGPDAVANAQRLAAEINALGTVSPPQDLEQFVADLETPNGPLAQFVAMRAEAPDGLAEVRVAYRCWPEERYVQIREDIGRIARSVPGATVSFPDDPFPAMVCPERDGNALARYLRRTIGRDRVRTMHAAIPFSGEDFALFLNQMPGTFTFLGVRAPGSAIETSYPHYATFTPDERAIGHGVRAMAGWLATRTATPPQTPPS